MKKYRRDSVFSECCGILFFLLNNDIHLIKGDSVNSFAQILKSPCSG
jgi:hypothetical protein